MKIISLIYYLLKRIFGQPNDYHIIADVIDAKQYVAVGQELRIVHRDYYFSQLESALWRLTREQIVNGLKADAILIQHSKMESFGWLDISYFQPCIRA